jgi:hypothetical protein
MATATTDMTLTPEETRAALRKLVNLARKAEYSFGKEKYPKAYSQLKEGLRPMTEAFYALECLVNPWGR